MDVDVFTLDNSNSKKEGVSQTYKGFKGYAPIAGYIGQEGYCLALPLREGKQHCQNGTPFILKRLATLASELTTHPLLFRLDSGNDDTSNFLEFAQSQSRLNHRIDFIIKWNPRTQLKSKHLVLSCTMLAYNLLRYMGQRGLSGEQPLLKKPAQRRRVKTVLQKLMYLAAKVVRTGRQLKLCFSRYCPQFSIFEKLYHPLVYE